MNNPIFKSITDERWNAQIHAIAYSPPRIGGFSFIELEGTTFPQYKYIDKRWAREFFETGQLRIGTLHDFSRVDFHGNRRGDQNEGARNYHQVGDSLRSIVVSTSSVNSYTFCTSSVLSRDIAKEFEADSVIEICEIDFFFEISKVMTMSFDIGSSTIGPIKYVNNEDVANFLLSYLEKGLNYEAIKAQMPNFARLKDSEFSSQSEVRAMWEPISPSAKLWPAGRPHAPSELYEGISTYGRHYCSVNEGIQAVFPMVPNARDYCRLIDI